MTTILTSYTHREKFEEKMYMLAVFLVSLATGKPVDEPIKWEERDGGFVFQGDMIMSKEQLTSVMNGGEVYNPHSYGLQKSTYRRWPNQVIPYVIHPKVVGIKGITGPTERAIKKAMKAWETKTCLKFKERTTERDYIEFINGGFGKCYSHVGKSGGKQELSLGFGCFTTGVAIHEIGHALGLHHEQSRPDRDDYVEIVWKNIKSGMEHNFKKYSTSYIDSRGSPYDYGSIMHYESNAFAKFPLFMATIRSKTKGAKFGQRSHISVEDAKQINKYYDCPSK